MKRQILTLLSVVLIFVACNKEESPTENKKPLSSVEAKQAIEGTMDNIYGCMKKLNDGNFSTFFYNTLFVTARTEIVTIDRGYSYYDNDIEDWVWVPNKYQRVEKSKWYDIIFKKFEEQYGDINREGEFSFDKYKGTYTWDSSLEKWNKSSNGTSLILKFPANKDATTNNAVFSIEYYQDQEVTYGKDHMKLPVRSKVTGFVDGQKIFGVEIKDVTFDMNTNFSIPLTADVQIYTAPFTQNFKWQRKNEKTFELNYNLTSEQGCSTSAKVEVVLDHSDYANISDLKKDIRRVRAVVTHNDLNIVMSLDMAGLASLNKDTYSVSDINDNYKGEVFYQNRKAADLKYNKDEKGEFSPEFIYSDGSKEKVRKYIQNFPDQVERIFKKYFDANK